MKVYGWSPKRNEIDGSDRFLEPVRSRARAKQQDRREISDGFYEEQDDICCVTCACADWVRPATDQLAEVTDDEG